MVGKVSPGSWTLPGYAHVQQLGTGAGGQVFLARHQESGTLVAVKYLVPGLHADGDFREAYRSEAQLLAELESPHVTRLYEYVEGPDGAAIVMEAVAGSSLRQLMKQEGATTPEAALCVLKGSLLGLAAAHESGVVHRDYKPANVLVTPEGISKLVDFGIAARSGEAAGAAGTPLYMAPEQFRGGPASPAADVYAATVTFFECVTGERPFVGKNAVELMAQHSLDTIPDDRVPEPLRPLIRSGMAKDPRARPPSALAFVAELERIAHAAYGPEWEERGQRKIATLLALLPLLLLHGAAQPVPAGTTSIATTELGAGAEAGAEAEGEAMAGLARRVRRRSRTIRATVGTGAAVALVVTAVAIASAAGGGGKKPGDSTGDSALVGATTLLTPLGSASVSGSLTASPTASSPSPSQTSPTPSATQSSTTGATTSPSGSPTSAATTPPATTSTSATTTHSASASASPTAQVDTITIGSVNCDGPSVGATATVTTNGLAGDTVTFTWFTLDANGGQTTFATTGPYTLVAGETSQTISSRQSFQAHEGGVNWGVTVSSTPAPSKGKDASMNINPYSSGCIAG